MQSVDVETGSFVLGASNDKPACEADPRTLDRSKNTPSFFPKLNAEAPLFLRKLAELTHSGKGAT